ncbi:MAG: UMP kinase [Thermoproteota archaeon]
MKLVLRIGGSVIASPINPSLIRDYVPLLQDLKEQGHQVAVVVGGGAVARDFIKAANDLGLDEETQDEVAISISRIIAHLVLRKLGESGCDRVPLQVEEVVSYLQEGKIPVMGGLRPGMTTDTVAALICERLDADLLVKATDQEGIYNKDPQKHENAVKLNHLRFEELSQVFDEDIHKAGIHQIIDPEAVKILKRDRIRVVVVYGFNPEKVMSAVEGEPVGTLIE